MQYYCLMVKTRGEMKFAPHSTDKATLAGRSSGHLAGSSRGIGPGDSDAPFFHASIPAQLVMGAVFGALNVLVTQLVNLLHIPLFLDEFFNAAGAFFGWTGGFSFAEVIENAGVIPLPPYLRRDAEASDATRYQTVYAEHDGSVAAPTAGLHFTPRVMAALERRGTDMEFLTLHVGAGTFKPVNTDTIGEHEMHVEKVYVTDDNMKHLAAHAGKPLVAVGTTSVRTLESLYWFGVQLADQPDMRGMAISQWDPYTLDDHHIDMAEAYGNVLQWMHRNGMSHLSGATQLMIAPGYRYRTIDGMVTNFHQPKSTLLLLVSAFVGDRWRDCYSYALAHDFRFLSYGDCCLFLK